MGYRSSLNLPNAVTLLRLLLSIPLVFAVVLQESAFAIAALGLAAITDWADGFIARRYHLETQLGAWLDPLADKVILNATFVALATQGLLPYWVAGLLLFRDLVIIGGAYMFFRANKVMQGQANQLGKISTLVQFSVLGWCILFPSVQINGFVLFVMVSVALGSGIVYVALWGRHAFADPVKISPASVASNTRQDFQAVHQAQSSEREVDMPRERVNS